MNTYSLIRISLNSLNRHKGRSFLTTLGIIIGIAAIIATLAIGKGAEEKTKQHFLAMGNNYIEIFSGNWFEEGKTTVKQQKKRTHLYYRDTKIMKRLCPGIQSISPVVSGREIVCYAGNNLLVTIKGGNQDFLSVVDRKIQRGIFFNKDHVQRGSRVAILGIKSAQELFRTLNPLGQTIRIKNVPFTVIGIVKKMKNFQGVHDSNFDIIVPIKALKKHVLKSHNQVIHSIIISAPTREEVPKIVQQLRRIMRFRRKLKELEPDTFTIIDQAAIMKAAQAGAATISLLLLIIASISLLVGGIGIMNIMLVSVTERTQEIGIRMALGATQLLILRQFLVEALALCFIGGCIGVTLGITIPYAVAQMTNWAPIVTTGSVLVALLTTSIIGIFFGFYPAYKASQLNPVDALAQR